MFGLTAPCLGSRRVNFGNATHVTIRVVVDDDNKAHLFVSLDRSDRSYYGCDAGCLDQPVKLGSVHGDRVFPGPLLLRL